VEFSWPASRPTKHRVRPFRGFFPFSVFPAAWSHIPPTVPRPPVLLRPQGFAPSRRFAPHTTCRAYFIPVPLLGFTLRGFCPRVAPYAVPDAGSLMRFHRFRRISSPLQGFSTLPEARPRCLGVNQNIVSCASLSFISYEVSCFRWLVSWFCSPSPLSRFFDSVFELTSSPAPQGFCHQKRSRSLSRSTQPPWSFLPRGPSRRFGNTVGLGY